MAAPPDASRAAAAFLAAGRPAGGVGAMAEANGLLLGLDAELPAVFKRLRDAYCRRFPELESVSLGPVDYARTVLRVGVAASLAGVQLGGTIVPAVAMVLAMAATTSKGRPLEPAELEQAQQLAHQVLAMAEQRDGLLGFIEAQMGDMAPNVQAIVGSRIASQLVGAAGGVRELAMIPAGNIQVIGHGRRELAGMSVASANVHAGFIYECDLVQSTGREHRSRAQRLVAAKVSLAARIDVQRPGSGQRGAQYREEIIKKLEAAAEAAPSKLEKPISAPILESRKRRGGKRARKQKEALAMTQARKLQNRVAFGEAESERIVGSTVVGMGMLSGTAGGPVRLPPVESRAQAPARRQEPRRGLPGPFATTHPALVSGAVTSLGLATGGIQLANPGAAPVEASRYFGKSGSFRKK